MATLHKFTNKKAAAFAAVDCFVERLKEVVETNGTARVVLPTGGSPAMFYEVLTSEYATAVEWDLVEWITLDELFGIDQRHDATFYSALKKVIWNPLKVKPFAIVALNPQPYDDVMECERFATLSRDADIVLLGVGADGHIGMNFPPAKEDSSCFILDLPEDGLPSKALFAEGETVPTQGITMGVSDILSGKTVMLLVDGEKKAKALDQLLNGEVSENWPVTYLQKHEDVRVFATEDALL